MNQGRRMSTSIARRLPWLAAVSAPVAIAFGVSMAGGWIAAWPGLLAAGATTLAICTLLWRPLGRLDRESRRSNEAAARALDRAQGELAAAARFNDALVARLPVPILLLDKTLRIRRANPAAATLLGVELAGRDLIAVLRHPDLIEAALDCIRGGAGRSVEVRLPVPLERRLGARVEPMEAPGADDIRAVVALEDLTALDRAERSRADFVANVSHELRTPLSSVIGFIETLRGPAREDRPAREKFLAIMDGQARRMARLVADLLSLSRIELDEHRAPTGRVSLAGILRAVAESLHMKAAERGIAIAFDAPPPGAAPACDLDALPPVLGEADELTQVFQNLIDNALKYSRERATVRIATWLAPGGSVAVAVMDQGEGIPREHLPRLTERFYRVNTARSRDLGGTGLGLAIVKHIVNRHRGELRIESEPGTGSTFTVIIPAISNM